MLTKQLIKTKYDNYPTGTLKIIILGYCFVRIKVNYF